MFRSYNIVTDVIILQRIQLQFLINISDHPLVSNYAALPRTSDCLYFGNVLASKALHDKLSGVLHMETDPGVSALEEKP